MVSSTSDGFAFRTIIMVLVYKQKFTLVYSEHALKNVRTVAMGNEVPVILINSNAIQTVKIRIQQS